MVFPAQDTAPAPAPLGHARYHMTGTPSAIANGTETVVDFATKTHGVLTRGAVTTGSGWKYTASAKVLLEIQVRVQFGIVVWDFDHNNIRMTVFVDGSEDTRLRDWHAKEASTSGLWLGLEGSTKLALEPGDEVDIRVRHNNSNNPTPTVGSAYSWICLTEYENPDS